MARHICLLLGVLWTVQLAAQQPVNPPGGAPESTDLPTLRSKADAGDARAQTEIGLRYIEGEGVPKSEEQAAEWFRKAAMQGDAEGQLELGVMYVNGEGFPADLREGYAWYWLSGQQGNATALEYIRDLEKSMPPAQREAARTRAAELAKTIEAARAAKPRHGQHRQSSASAAANAASAQPAPVNPLKTPAATRSAPPAKPGAAAGKTFTEGKDYAVWQRVRIKDQNGFGQPVEAYSILLPKGWKTEGAVNWVINTACPADAIQNRVTAISPDGTYRLDIFPQRNWQWFDDPMMLQNAQNNARMGFAGCPLARPYNAGQYLEYEFVPTDLMGAKLIRHQPSQEIMQRMQEQAQQNNALYRASGVNLESRPSAEIGYLQWQDGRIGIALCAVEQTVALMPNLLNGGNYASYQCRVTVKTVLSAPSGRSQEAEKMLGTIVSSTRINPDWLSAVQSVYRNIAQVEMRETAKRAAIWRQTQNEIGDLQRRTWESAQASRDRIAEGWGQALRGVESWKEPDGNSIELSAGYNEAWSKGDGTYILSNDPLFDPNVAFQENWSRLQKPEK